jgi:prophage maintenance system killer protein
VIYLDLPDVLAVAAHVLESEPAAVVQQADVDAVGLVLSEARVAGDQGAAGSVVSVVDVADVAAVLLGGLVRRRPFVRRNRRVALVATLHFLNLNGWDMFLQPVGEIDHLLDRVAAGAPAWDLAAEIRARLRSHVTEAIPDVAEEMPDVGEAVSYPPEEVQERLAAELSQMENDLLSGRREPTLFEQFTDRARRAVVVAQEEARKLSHSYIGTEHLLLALIHVEDGVAAKALSTLGVSTAAVRAQVLEIVGEGSQAPSGHIPFTPRAKKVLELSLREALQLGHKYIGTEHILLGLVREGEGVAAQVLVKLGADLGRVRQQVVQMLGKEIGADDLLPEPGAHPGRRELIMREVTVLLDENDRLRGETDRLAAEVSRLRGLLRQHRIDPDAA